MDRREIREVSGYTFTNQQSRAESWYDSAISFREGANVFGLHKDSIPGGTRVFLANVALSIELLLKAIIVAKNGIAPRTHRLPRLVHDAGVPFSTNQEATLELLGELLIWSGRYPVPNKAEDWDHYYDVVFERHVIRVREGSAAMVLANRETFPSARNCEKLWDLASRKWDEIQLNKQQTQIGTTTDPSPRSE
jgi:HEPN domain-containing protein